MRTNIFSSECSSRRHFRFPRNNTSTWLDRIRPSDLLRMLAIEKCTTQSDWSDEFVFKTFWIRIQEMWTGLHFKVNRICWIRISNIQYDCNHLPKRCQMAPPSLLNSRIIISCFDSSIEKTIFLWKENHNRLYKIDGLILKYRSQHSPFR